MDIARPAAPFDSLSSTYCLQQDIAFRRNVMTSRSLLSLKSFTDMPSALPVRTQLNCPRYYSKSNCFKVLLQLNSLTETDK